ncbi:MAG: RsmD family RNA methyltransferase, partial [Bacteroidia bacterium]
VYHRKQYLIVRIIGGSKSGIIIHAPQNLPVRPTTDRSKESLFNILENKLDWEGLICLDLFTGTGNISYELASRGVAEITSVDKDFGCVRFVKETAVKLGFKQIQVRKQDVFVYLKSETKTYDLIFADPPYALDKIVDLSSLVFEKGLLSKTGYLIIEHGSHLDLSSQSGFFEGRKYGQSTFSFFRNPNTHQEIIPNP